VLDLLAGVNDKITIDERNLVLERDEAAAAGIDRAPTILVLSAGDGQPRDVGVRFVGAPLGYEFTALVDAILLVSRGDAELSDASRLLLASVTSPMTLQVFTTPT
jgi:alkyl hydroperoxide reductase subunit AhpF